MKKRIIFLMIVFVCGIILVGCGQSEEEKAAIESFNKEVARIQDEAANRDKAVEAANALLNGDKPPLYEEDKEPLKEAIKEATAVTFEAPEVPKELKDITAKTEELKKINMIDVTNKLTEATAAFETSVKKCEKVTEPTEEYVIECLKTVENIDKIEAVTEDHDPNEMLGKQGGYTTQVYFSSPLVPDPYGIFTGDVIEDGTACGGSIEVFETSDNAKTREAYLAGFDSTGGFASGSHKVIGTCIIRTSNDLTATQQQELEAAIIEALTKLD